MRNFITVVNNATPISTTVIGGVSYVNINGTKTQIIKGQVSFPAAPTATAAGTAGAAIVTLTGTYVAGDQVRVTLSLPNSGQRLIKSYVHTVVTGGTSVDAVAAALAALITADITAGLPGVATAISAAGVLTITQDTKLSAIFSTTATVSGAANVVVYADSAAGVATVTGTATTFSQGTPADLIAEGVDAGDIGLATYSTVLLKAKIDGAFPFIDSDGKTVKEIKFYSTNAICVALIAAL